MATKTSRKDSTTSSSSYGDAGLNCVIAPGTKIEGDFTTTENVRIDGSVVGHIKCDRKLVLGKNANVEGTLTAAEAVLMGTVVGDVTVGGLLKLEGTAVVKGDIVAKKIIVDEGAKYDGISKIG